MWQQFLYKKINPKFTYTLHQLICAGKKTGSFSSKLEYNCQTWQWPYFLNKKVSQTKKLKFHKRKYKMVDTTHQK